MRRFLLILSLAAPLYGQDVLTQHNDTDRTGHNPRETVLTPAAVRVGFGRLFDLPVDGQVYAQPLVVGNVYINGRTRNVLVAATTHNTLYEFDADSGEMLWSHNYGRSARSPQENWPNLSVYHDMTPEVGIVSTPLVDRASGTIFFTSFVQEADGARFHYWIHAIDLVTHEEKNEAPVEIRYDLQPPPGMDLEALAMNGSCSFPHPCADLVRPGIMRRHSVTTSIPFVTRWQMQRPAVLLTRGRLVLAFASFGDASNYHGWVFSYDARHLRQKPAVWNSTPDFGESSAEALRGGVWQSGMGLALDNDGAIFFFTGNGRFDESKKNFGDSAVKLKLGAAPSIEETDFFTPCSQECLDSCDLDLGSSGVMHIPGTQLLVGGGKEGILYLLDANNLGGFGGDGGTCRNRMKQQLQGSCGEHIHGSPVYWKSASRGSMIYVWGEDDHLRAFPFNGTQLTPTDCKAAPNWRIGAAWSPAALAEDKSRMGMTGGMLSLSSSGGGRNGILWATTPLKNDANQLVVPGVFRAYDADDLTNELWNSEKTPDRDLLGNYAKFTPPTVANGKVYVATFSNRVSVYGLNPPPAPAPPQNLIVNGDFEGSTGAPWTASPAASFVSNAFPYRGQNSARFISNETSPTTLSQTVTAPADGDYVLTAYCNTDVVDYFGAPAPLVRVSVAGATAGERAVSPGSGYLPYRIQFAAKQGEAIAVSFIAPQLPTDYPSAYASSNWAWSMIDTVTLVRK